MENVFATRKSQNHIAIDFHWLIHRHSHLQLAFQSSSKKQPEETLIRSL